MCMLSADLSILADAGSVIAIGFSVVFLMLLLLTTVFKIFGTIMSKTKHDDMPVFPVTPVAPQSVTAPAVAPIVGNTEEVSSKPGVDGGIPEETVAVVSAAVAAMAPENTQYVVKGIRKL